MNEMMPQWRLLKLKVKSPIIKEKSLMKIKRILKRLLTRKRTWMYQCWMNQWTPYQMLLKLIRERRTHSRLHLWTLILRRSPAHHSLRMTLF